MKTIGHLVNTFLRFSEGFIYDQVVGIKNFQVEVLTREYVNKDLFVYDKINSIDDLISFKKYYNFYTYTFFLNCNYFSQIVKKKFITLIHAHFGPNGVYALNLKFKHKIPLIVTFYGHDVTRLPKFTLFPPSWFHYWRNFDLLKKEADLFLAISNFIGNKLEEKGFPKQKIKVNYLGIKIDKNKKFFNKIKTNTILTVARLVEKKGTEYLIKAIGILKNKYPDIVLYICGDGPLKNKLKNLTAQLKLEKNVIFMGWTKKNDVFKLMDKSDIFVLPSITAKNGDAEGLGVVILEAMMHGLPVVGTFNGGIPEAVTDKETGFLVEEKNEKSLAEAIDILLSDYYLAQKMGMKGREILEEKFNLDRQIETLEKIYNEFL